MRVQEDQGGADPKGRESFEAVVRTSETHRMVLFQYRTCEHYMDAEEVTVDGDHFRGVTKMMTDRDLLEMEFNEQELTDLREIFSRNDTKCMDFDKKVTEKGE